MDFGTKLLSLREEAKQNQTEVAKNLETTQRKISYWETGQTEPSLDDLRRICKYFQISADYLLGLTDDPRPYPPPRRGR